MIQIKEAITADLPHKVVTVIVIIVNLIVIIQHLANGMRPIGWKIGKQVPVLATIHVLLLKIVIQILVRMQLVALGIGVCINV